MCSVVIGTFKASGCGPVPRWLAILASDRANSQSLPLVLPQVLYEIPWSPDPSSTQNFTAAPKNLDEEAVIVFWYQLVDHLPGIRCTLLMPITIGNRKRDCAWGCARKINTTSENLQIEKDKSGRRSPDWFVLFDLQIFWGGLYPPSATSRTIFFLISNSFWH